jgi:hypothetical protein
MRSLALALMALLAPALALASAIGSALPGAELRGVATLRFVGFAVYEARLFTSSGKPLDWSEDFALELTYLRSFSKAEIVDSTLQEFARTGGAMPVQDQLDVCFAAVTPGDWTLAISQGPDQVGIWRNDAPACTLSHPQMKLRFMSIFLGDNSRSPAFTRKLKGE